MSLVRMLSQYSRKILFDIVFCSCGPVKFEIEENAEENTSSIFIGSRIEDILL